jgi:hypothetical protein
MKAVVLRNGTIAADVVAKDMYARLKRVFDEPKDRPLLEALLQHAIDPSMWLPADVERKLIGKGLLPLQPMARSVVMSALYGHGKDLMLVDPDARVPF